MKQHEETAKEPKKVRLRNFGMALLLSLAMIGAACVYAYQATTASLEKSMETLENAVTTPLVTTDFVANSYNAYVQETTVVTTDEPDWQAVVNVQTDVPVTPETEPTPMQTQPPVTEAQTNEEEESAEETETIPLQYAHVCIMPVAGEVIQPYSNGELVKSETTGTWQTHNGTDFAGEVGDSVSAMDNGTVSEIVKDPLWGICVKIDHGNGVTSRYCGLNASLSVQEGDIVESGQAIGSIGTTADVESKQPSHLHFEVQKNGRYVDPVAYVSQENQE